MMFSHDGDFVLHVRSIWPCNEVFL